MRTSTVDRRVHATDAANDIWVRRQRAMALGRQLHGEVMGRVIRVAGAALGLIRIPVVARLRRLARQRRNTSMLLSLNDRMLADLGLMRADVQGLAYGVIPMPQLTSEPTFEPLGDGSDAMDVSSSQLTDALRGHLREAA
jgi:uncharacterized protein YjiS (DUF1127 family)